MSDSLMRLRIATTDAEEAHAWLRDAYVDHSARLSGQRDSFRFSHRLADCGKFMVGMAQHTMTLHGEWEPLDEILLFGHLLSGRFDIRSHIDEVAAGPGDVFAYDPDAQMSVMWADIRMAQIRMRRGAVERVVAELVGDNRTSERISFDLARPLTRARATQWKRLMQYVTNDVAANPIVHSSPLIMGQVFRLIVATSLETFPNSTLDLLGRQAPAASPRAVRRAVEFIESNAAADIGLTEIAEAAHVGPRALQRAFRRSLDVTPVGYLRSVRLDRAHDDLRESDGATTTVAELAARWGFAHPGRFAVAYRVKFGHSPSETLRG